MPTNPLRFEMQFLSEVQRARFQRAAEEKGVSLVAWLRDAGEMKLARQNAEKIERERIASAAGNR